MLRSRDSARRLACSRRRRRSARRAVFLREVGGAGEAGPVFLAKGFIPQGFFQSHLGRDALPGFAAGFPQGPIGKDHLGDLRLKAPCGNMGEDNGIFLAELSILGDAQIQIRVGHWRAQLLARRVQRLREMVKALMGFACTFFSFS